MDALDPKWCRVRRERLVRTIAQDPRTSNLTFPIYLTHPIHLTWLSGFHNDPFNLGSGFGGLLQLEKSGEAKLFHHDRVPDNLEVLVPSVEGMQRIVLPWYDGVHFPKVIRPLGMLPPGFQGRILDLPTDPVAPALFEILSTLRRAKDPDELSLLRRCAAIQEAGHQWARQNIAPEMTEIEIYAGVNRAVCLEAGHPAVLYGDFAVSPGPERKGGPATGRILKRGDLFILDFSVVLTGYRCDFTTTLAVGRPTERAREMMTLCLEAMKAGEKLLKAGEKAAKVHDGVNSVFKSRGLDQWFGHHAGHGLGLTHPEAPFLVADSLEILVKNDVITLEPGLYIPGQGGIRIERNYRILENGFECLSHHPMDFEL